MSGAPVQKFGTEQLQLDPAQQALLQGNQGALLGKVADAQQGAQQAASGFQTNFGQFTPQLQTEFAGPQFGDQLDSYSKNIVSQGTQDATSRLGATQQGIARQFGATSPGLSQVLQQHAAIQSQLGTNPLTMQAALAQRQRQASEYQLGQGAQAQTNATRLAQAGAGANAQNLQNQALGQRAQLQAAPAEMQQTLLAVLAAMSGLTGKHVSSETPTPAPVDNRSPLQKALGLYP